MTGDPLQRFVAGEPLSLRADTMNALVDAAKQVRRERSKGLTGASVTGYGGDPPYLEILVRNDTGADLDEYGIVRPADTLLDVAAYPLDTQERPLLQGLTPSAGGVFAVCLEPIPEDQIGRAIIMGVALVNLSVAASGDTYASCTSATDKLTTSTTGTCKILWKQSGTGDKLGLVLMQSAGGGGLTTANVDTTEESTTARLEFDQATGIRVDAGATDADPDVVSIDTATLCAVPGFADCLQGEMTFDVNVSVWDCLSIVVGKTFVTVDGQSVVQDFTLSLVGKKKTITLPAETVVSAAGVCEPVPDCCPDGEDPLTDCCDERIPRDLEITVSGGGGTYPLTYNGSAWETGTITVPGCGDIAITWTCGSGTWEIGGGAAGGCGFAPSGGTMTGCDGGPFESFATTVEFIDWSGGPCSCDGVTKTLTITPVTP